MSNLSDQHNIILSLAPFQGITDHIYRQVFQTHFDGIDKMYTPFFTAVHKANSKSLQGPEIDPKLNNLRQLVPQILTNDATELFHFSEHCANLGYQEININLGCPYPRVAKKQRGSGLLPYAERVDALLEQHFTTSLLPTGIKSRLGYENETEIEALIKVFNRYPLSELIIHARTGKQLYKGQVLLDSFAAALGNLNINPGYNGDIFNSAEFNDRKTRFPAVNHFMLGRGILSDPFLASDIRNIPQAADRKMLAYQFIMALYEQRKAFTNNNPAIIGRMKELWSYLLFSFDEPQVIWRKIKKTNSFIDYEDVVQQIFDSHQWIGQGFPIDKAIIDL